MIQFICSSWAEKMIILTLKSGGVGLFNYLFLCIVSLGMLCYYMLNGALYVILSVGFVIARFLKLRETNDNGWL